MDLMKDVTRIDGLREGRDSGARGTRDVLRRVLPRQILDVRVPDGNTDLGKGVTRIDGPREGRESNGWT